MDAAGDVYFSDNGNNVVRRIDAFNGTIATVAGTLGATPGFAGDGGLATSATLNNPNGLSLDDAGNLYIADTSNHAIRKVDATTGLISTIAGTGTPAFTGDNGPATAAALSSPWGVTFAPSGKLYIADQNNHRIRVVDTSGIITTLVGNGVLDYTGDGGPAANATLNSPAGIAVDVAGNVYIADSGNNVIRKINAVTGIISTIAGDNDESISGDNGPATKAGMYSPFSLVITDQGSLLIADTLHSRVREVYSNLATLTYKAIRVGRVSAPLSQTLENDGNAPLNIASVTAISNAQVDADSTTCSSTSPLVSLDQCVIGADFAPTVIGNPVVGTIDISTDAANSPDVLNLVGQVLNVDPATVTLTSSSNPSITGAVVVFNVVVTSAGTTPTGTISLMDGSNVIATAQLAIGGTASFNVSTLAAGSHNITAAYAGDSSNASGTSDILVQVVKDQVADTTTTLSSTANPVVAGAALFFTAQVAPAIAGAGQGAITGTVVFKSGLTQLGSSNITNGVATLSYSALPVGTDSVIATYTGNNNYGVSSSIPLAQRVQIASSTTVLTSSANPSDAGAPVTLAATISGNGGTPGGTVTFFDGSISLGNATLNTRGIATLIVPGSNWTVGTHTLTAVYAGDASDTTSTSPTYSQLIRIASSSAKVVTSLSPAALGASVTFTATVTSTGGIPTGTLQFLDGNVSLGTSALNGQGGAAINVSNLALGSHNISVAYAGDAYDSPSTSTSIIQVIQPANIAAVLYASSNPATFGAPVTFTATITGNGSSPVGSVTFTDGANSLGVVTLNAQGIATLSTSTLAIGSHSINAAYSGDVNHAAVGSNTVALTVVQGTTTTLSASNLAPIAGSTVTFTAAVTGADGQPTSGTIAILDGKTTIATLTPNPAGVATLTGATLAPGTHIITAVFAGDRLDGTSTSAPLTQVITIATTAVSLATSANPTLAGTPVTFSTSVTGNGGIPTGNVAFLDGSRTLATLPVNGSGSIVYTTSSLAPGIHTITAKYLGDTDDSPALSSPISQQIAEKTSVTLTSSANPSLLTDNVTLTASVINGVPTNPPTGQVTLTDGGTTVATATLNASGSATFTLTAPALGQHTLAVSYSGDDDNVPAASANLIQTVVLRPTTTSLTTSSTAISTGQQLILISVVQGSGNHPPTGTVTFASGSTVFGSVPIGADGVATLTVEPLQGIYKVISTYSGDTLFALSASASVTVTVGPPIEFTLNMQPPTMSMATGAHGSAAITVFTAATFHDKLAFGCAGLPASATCTFSTDLMSVGGGETSTLSVIVDTGDPLGVGTAHIADPGLHSQTGGGILACMLPAGAFLAILLGRKRSLLWKTRKPLGLFVVILLLVGAATLSGCGSTFNTRGTPAGTYNFQIVATGQSTGATETANVTLTVSK